MEHIKILISACSILTSTFSVLGDKAPTLSYSQTLDTAKTVECVKEGNKINELHCFLTTSDKKTSKILKESAVIYKFAKVDDSTFMLVNDTKSQIYHVKKSGVIYHERELSEDASSEKVCVGKLEEKK